MKVLVINAGSSSIKYQLFDMPDRVVLARGAVAKIGEEHGELVHHYGESKHTATVDAGNHEQAMATILQTLVDPAIGVIRDGAEIEAVGHRVVHGGEEFTGSVLIDDRVIASLEKYADLAPLHNPPNLIGIRASQHTLPTAQQVACFDTAFHATIPEVAFLYALPYEIYEKFRVRRYGFHGTSHRYVARRAAALLGRDKYDLNAITCHLGNGCSIAAVRNGRSVETSMGLTPLEGVVMGTRSGDFDPAILFYLADKGYDLDTLNDMCNKKSGLLGISGKSNDMRNLETLAQQGERRAQLAIDIFCYRIKKYIGAYTAVLDTVDALIFTGGIGENAVSVRERVCTGLSQIGLEIDLKRNGSVVGVEGQISTAASRIAVWVIPTNEEAAIAADTYELGAKAKA